MNFPLHFSSSSFDFSSMCGIEVNVALRDEDWDGASLIVLDAFQCVSDRLVGGVYPLSLALVFPVTTTDRTSKTSRTLYSSWACNCVRLWRQKEEEHDNRSLQVSLRGDIVWIVTREGFEEADVNILVDGDSPPHVRHEFSHTHSYSFLLLFLSFFLSFSKIMIL